MSRKTGFSGIRMVDTPDYASVDLDGHLVQDGEDEDALVLPRSDREKGGIAGKKGSEAYGPVTQGVVYRGKDFLPSGKSPYGDTPLVASEVVAKQAAPVDPLPPSKKVAAKGRKKAQEEEDDEPLSGAAPKPLAATIPFLMSSKMTGKFSGRAVEATESDDFISIAYRLEDPVFIPPALDNNEIHISCGEVLGAAKYCGIHNEFPVIGIGVLCFLKARDDE